MVMHICSCTSKEAAIGKKLATHSMQLLEKAFAEVDGVAMAARKHTHTSWTQPLEEKLKKL